MAAWTLAGLAGGGPAAPAPASRDTVVVELTNELTYLPDTVRVRPGGVVRWENASLLVHTVTADPAKATVAGSVGLPDRAQPFDSGHLEPGAAFTHRFEVPGVYHYFCIPHEAAKMRGVVIVG